MPSHADLRIDLDGLRPLLVAALAEDVGPGDVTSRICVPDGARGRGRLRAKAHGVLAGMAVFCEVMRLAADGDLAVVSCLQDGSPVGPGDEAAVVEGSARGLLAGERTALNFLQRLSGVATLTRRLCDAVRGTPARILDTRKTTAGLRALEKHAVRAGGGENHRFGLYDAVLVKENHLAFCDDLAAALGRRPPGMAAVVEAESPDEALAAAAAGADVVLLDDFSPEQVAETVRALEARGDRRPLLEVSGGITPATARAYAEAGADRISVGALTHSAPALDLSLSIERLSGR